MESLHRLSEAELRDQEGPLPSPVHRPNHGLTGRIELLLLPRRIFGLQSDCHLSRRSREDNIHMSLWHIRLQTHAICTMQRPRELSLMYDGDLLRLSWLQLRSFYGRLQCLWKQFESCLAHLTKILEVCVRKRLVLSWEKSHFMVREGVVLGHIISGK